MPLPPNYSAPTILYVEDNQASRMALAQVLRDQGFQVLEAGTAQEALRLAEEKPDLILLDVHPPDADAFDLCERFKTTPTTASVPVLLFSGVHIKSEDRVRGLEGGADGYLTKPVESAEVLAQIKALLRIRRGEEALARLAAIVESSEDAVIGNSLDGTITSWNAGAERLYAYTAREALGQPISLLAPPGRLDEIPDILHRLRQGERVDPFETVRVRKDGARVDVSVSVSPIKDAAGRIIGAAKIARDISQRKAAEEALRKSELLFRQVTENIHEVFWLLEAQSGAMVYVSPAYETIWGRTIQSLYDDPRSYLDAVHPDDRDRVAAAFDHLRMEGKSEEEYRVVRPDGSIRRIWDRGYPVCGLQGRIERFVGIAEDVTARKAVEAERDAALHSLRVQIERMPLVRIVLDADMRIVDWNPAAERLFGFRAEEALGRGLELFVPPEFLAGRGEELLRRLRSGDMTAHSVNTNRTKDGRTIVCQWFNTPVLDAAGQFIGLLCMAQDVTDRIAAEEALHLRDRAIQAVTQGILITDPRLPDNPITYASPGFEQLTGYAAAEVVGRNCRFLQGPDTDASAVVLVREAVRNGRPCSVEILNYRKGGAVFWNSLSISPVRDAAGIVTHFVGVQADVTERKKAEASLAQLAAIVVSSEDAIISAAPDGKVMSWNPGAERLFGFTASEMVGNDIGAFIPPIHQAAALAVKARILQGEDVPSFEAERRHKDGRTLHTSVTLSALRDSGGRIVGIAGISRDMCRQRTVEQSLRESEERFRGAFDYTGVAMVLADADARFIRVNMAFARMFGYSPPEMLGMTIAGVTHPDDRRQSHVRLKQLFVEGGHFFQMEKRYIHRDGHTFWGLTNVSLVRDSDGRPVLYVGQVQDVTDRKGMEQRLTAQHAIVSILAQASDLAEAAPKLLRTVCETTGWDVGALWLVDRQANVLSCVDLWHVESMAAAEFDAASRRTTFASGVGLPGRIWATGQPAWIIDVMTDLNFSRVSAAAAAGLHGGFAVPISFEEKVLGVAEFFSRDSRPPDEELLRMVASLGIQIGQFIERKRGERGLQLFRALIDQTLDGIEVIDPETGRFLDVNERACLTHGYTRDEYLSLSVPDLDPQVATRPWEVLMAERRLVGTQSFEGLHRRKDGSTFPVEVNLNFIHLDRDYLVAVVRDVTARRLLEDQFHRAQKMEAFGQLAGGVAHDFNNVIQVITGYGEILLAKLPVDDPAHEMVGEMVMAGTRAAGLTRQLLAFSRQQVVAPRVLDLNVVVADLEKMLRRVLGEDMNLTTTLLPELGRVKADPGQIEQVVLNLAVNARDAMPQGGWLTIETQNIELDEDYARLHVGVRTGPHVLLAASDTGSGMTPEVKARIFEPFFTTKEQGKGTGLGLSTVFGIVQQAGGHVTVYSELDVGTTFKVYLPRVEEEAASPRPRSDHAPSAGGSETVLLVEDENSVRSLSRIVLQGAGYHVLEACDGGEALDIAADHEAPIHLLLTDVVMPVLGGRQLAERLLALHPEAKVLFQSGYTDDAVVRHGVLQERVHFLQKPYSPTALTQKVREVLDGPE